MATSPTPPEPPIKRVWKTTLAWIAGITAVLGFIGTLTGTFHKINDHFTHPKELDNQIALAQNQAKQDEYPQAIQTLAAVLKTDPHYAPALDAQFTIAEKWVENFHIESGSGQDPKTIAAAWLDQIFPVFDAAILRAQVPQLADAQAHRGWAHWLNRKIAQRESGELAMQDLQAALSSDAHNVYAHAMLGNILLILQRLSEAALHFDSAVATGRERTLVRKFEFGALIGDSEPGACAFAYKIANAMRQGSESLDVDHKHDLLSWCFPFNSASHDMRTESLSALPRNDAWQTYLWLEEGSADTPQLRELKRKFVQAMLAELAGDKAAALTQFRALQNDKAARFTALDTAIPDEIQRVSTQKK